MGALINVFKSLFGGILSFLGGLVGGKKDKAVKPIAAKKVKKPKKGKDGFFMDADADAMEEILAAPIMAVEAAAPVATNADKKADKKGKKDKTAVKAAPAKAPAKAAPMMTPEELIMAAVQPKPVDATAAAAGTAGFATQYMVPTLTSGRRSPGPSLKMFKTMAKEIRG